MDRLRDRGRSRPRGRPRRIPFDRVSQSVADQHDARSSPEVAVPAPEPQPHPQPLSQADILLRFTQAVEHIEALLTGQAVRGQPAPLQNPAATTTPAPVVAPVAPPSDAESRLTRFLKLIPPRFDGRMGDDPYNFTFTIERCFETMELIDDSARIRLASFLLDGRAASWWQNRGSQRVATWDEFKRETMDGNLDSSGSAEVFAARG